MKHDYAATNDFLNDESFIQWISNSNDVAVNYWENWIKNNPAKKQMAYNARITYEAFFIEETIPDKQIDKAEKNLFQHLKKNQSAKVFRLYNKRWWLFAASIVLLTVTTIGFWQYLSPRNSLKTDFGQMAQQVLPDGSQVTLNANSSIYYNKWKENANREVWLKGEAFFHVKKTADHKRFIVHANHFDIIVTGTQFNVVNRDTKTNVMLTEGSVTIKKNDGEQIFMKPGDFIEVNNNAFVKKEEKKENVLAWKEHKLYFDNLSMREAAKMIEEQYGVTIKFADDSTALKTISGILPNNNLDLLLSSLEATADFKINRDNNEIIIQRP